MRGWRGPRAMWTADVVVDGLAPVRVVIDNGINGVYLQALIRDPLDDQHPRLLLEVAERSGIVGMTCIDGELFLRCSCILEDSSVDAIAKTLLAVAHATHDFLGELAGNKDPWVPGPGRVS